MSRIVQLSGPTAGNGPLLSSTQFALLVEPAATGQSGPTRARVQEILTSIVLCGPAQFDYGPTPPLAEEDGDPFHSVQRLSSLGLLTLSRDDPGKTFRNRLLRAYTSAFFGFRDLDGLPGASSLSSVEALRHAREHRGQYFRRWLRATSKVDTGTAFFEKDVFPMVESLGLIFDHYFSEEFAMNHAFLNEHLSGLAVNGYGQSGRDPVAGGWSNDEMFSLMGMRRASADELDEMSDFYSFNPGSMASLYDFACSRGNAIPFFAQGIQMGMAANPKAHLWLSAFWRTVSESVGLLSQSSKSRRPLLLPATAKVPERATINPVSCADDMALFRVFLSERVSLPRLNTPEDAARLLADSRLAALRTVISEWKSALAAGELDRAALVRRDLAAASREIKGIEGARQAAWIAGIAAIPAALIDFSTGVPVGTVLGLFGTGVEAWARWRLRRHHWIQFGL